MSVIRPRDSWGPVYRDGCEEIGIDAWTEIYAHHTVTRLAEGQTEEEHMRYLEDIGHGKFGCGISYTVVIFPSGNAWEGHSLDKQGAHTYGHNDTGRALCFVGNFMEDTPTDAALNTASDILTEWRDEGYPSVITGGHRDVYNTDCPGDNLYDVLDSIQAGESNGDEPVTEPTIRTMYDAVTPSNIPQDAEMVAGYVDGRYAWDDSDYAMFPNAFHVHIAVFADTNDGEVLDVEPGDATPVEAPAWVTLRRAAGIDPVVYCNLSTWPNVKAEFDNQGVDQPHYWIAHYNGDPEIPEGAIAKQYIGDQNGVDISSVNYWPGLDNDTPSTEEDFLMALAPWQQERMFERILSMSEGKAGENFDGAQNTHEKEAIKELSDKLDALTAKVDSLQSGTGGVTSTVKVPTAEENAAAVIALMKKEGN